MTNTMQIIIIIIVVRIFYLNKARLDTITTPTKRSSTEKETRSSNKLLVQGKRYNKLCALKTSMAVSKLQILSSLVTALYD